jgi:hypothetical protein
MSTVASDVARRVDEARARIERAGGRGVSIVAVTKGFGVEALLAAAAAGLHRIGENYAQEIVPKVLGARAAGVDLEVHFIGHLQTNKIRSLAPVVDVWETVDRASAVAELARRVPQGARILVQVNSTGESNKAGCAPADVAELVAAARSSGLQVGGLMTMGPTEPDAARTRAAFRLTRELVDRHGLADCSMGMSGDLEIAVEEGATLVRLGSALFGERPRR